MKSGAHKEVPADRYLGRSLVATAELGRYAIEISVVLKNKAHVQLVDVVMMN